MKKLLIIFPITLILSLFIVSIGYSQADPPQITQDQCASWSPAGTCYYETAQVCYQSTLSGYNTINKPELKDCATACENNEGLTPGTTCSGIVYNMSTHACSLEPPVENCGTATNIVLGTITGNKTALNAQNPNGWVQYQRATSAQLPVAQPSTVSSTPSGGTGNILLASMTDEQIVSILGNDDQGNPKPHNMNTIQLILPSFMLRYGAQDTRDPSVRECKLGMVYKANDPNSIIGNCAATSRSASDESVCKNYQCVYSNADPKIFTATFDIAEAVLNQASLVDIFADNTQNVALTFRVNIQMDRDNTNLAGLYNDNLAKTYTSSADITTTNATDSYCDIGVTLSKNNAEITSVTCQYRDGETSVTDIDEFVNLMKNPASYN